MLDTPPFDWSTLSDKDWNDMDADDPRRSHKGFKYWMYYAQPIYTRSDGSRYQPREFRTGSLSTARKIIAASPSGRGHITRWDDRAQSRILIEDVQP